MGAEQQQPELTQKAITNSTTKPSRGWCGCVQVEDLMEEGSVVNGAGNGKASDSHSLVMEIEMDKLPEHNGGANEKLFIKVKESDATRIVEKGSCSSWVVEMEKMIKDVEPSVEKARWSGHSIYRVPQFMKHETNSEAYSPQFVSLGPLHHGEPHLLPMEEHKRRAVAHMVKRSGRRLQDFVAAIDEVADELQAAYSELDDKWLGANKGRFVEVMVTDGCFLLEWIRARYLGRRGEVNEDYATNDPIFSNGSSFNLWATMRQDMIYMENQIPLVVLQRLLAVQLGRSVTAREINNNVQRLLGVPRFDEGMDKLGLHFLDILRRSYYCGSSPQLEGSVKYAPRTTCAVELAEAGIRFKKSNTNSIGDVDFKNGVLSMPLFELQDDTEVYLLNMMAFEWLHPDSNFYVSQYISFVDKIIMSERDAALLRSEGVFENLIGSDKKVVKMFNTLTKLAWEPDEGSKLGEVIWKANSHCKKRRNKWRASFMNTYLGNPWLFTSMVAAIILLIATLLQTVYTVVPFYTKG